MIFTQTMMQMSKHNKQILRLVMLHESGLAIHKGEEAYSKTWVISHFNSGRSVLKYIIHRKDVEKYIIRLIYILPSWNFTLEEFNKGSVDNSEWGIDKKRLKRVVDEIQKEILSIS